MFKSDLYKRLNKMPAVADMLYLQYSKINVITLSLT